jgi:ferric-dicitrate binding protein FerR (iron transport regulator)
LKAQEEVLKMAKDLIELFHKYQEGKTNLQEELILSEKLADPSDQESEQLLKSGLHQSFEEPAGKEKDLNPVLNRIHHIIHLKRSARKQNPVHLIYHRASRVAAVLLISLLTVNLYFMLKGRQSGHEEVMLQIIAPAGARVNFELPDGSLGILNSGSRLNYSTGFSSNRRVELVGEAWFDVEKDKQHPFVIDANENKITVVGTRFSLAAYPADKSTELILEEGKVLFQSPGMRSAMAIHPGERLIEKNGQMSKEEVETWRYTAWKEGKLVFRNDSMEELAQRISRWYNVDVEIRGEGLKDYKFRGVFENDPLEEVLRLLKMTSPIDYEIRDRQTNADGSFGRKQVILTKK